MGTTNEDIDTMPNTPTQNAGNHETGELQGDVDVAESVETIEYDEESARYRVSYDPTVDSTSLAVVGIVAALERTDPTTLEPIFSVVDPGALDTLFSEGVGTRSRRGLQVSFHFTGFDVTVRGGGVVELEAADGRRSAGV